jgi:hypothetical protein
VSKVFRKEIETNFILGRDWIKGFAKGQGLVCKNITVKDFEIIL